MAIAAKDAPADRIARLFAEGYPLAVVLDRGGAGGWTRAEVEMVLAARGWRLGGDGRVPRELRPALSPKGAVPARPSNLPASARDVAAARAAGADGRRSVPELGSTTTLPRGTAGTAFGVVVDPAKAATAAAELEARAARRPAPGQATPSGRPLEQLPIAELLALGGAHKAASVQNKARRARAAVDALRAELVERRESDAADALLARELAALTERLTQLDRERARIAAEIVGRGGKLGKSKVAPLPPSSPNPSTPKDGKPAALPAAGRAPIREHGSWGGYLAHRARGEAACAECDAARSSRGRS